MCVHDCLEHKKVSPAFSDDVWAAPARSVVAGIVPNFARATRRDSVVHPEYIRAATEAPVRGPLHGLRERSRLRPAEQFFQQAVASAPRCRRRESHGRFARVCIGDLCSAIDANIQVEAINLLLVDVPLSSTRADILAALKCVLWGLCFRQSR